jgi:hypothetical protein
VLTSTPASNYPKLSLLEMQDINDNYHYQIANRKIRIERIIILGASDNTWRYANIEETLQTPNSNNNNNKGIRTTQVEVTCTQVPTTFGDKGAQLSNRCVVRDPATLVSNNWSLKLIG